MLRADARKAARGTSMALGARMPAALAISIDDVPRMFEAVFAPGQAAVFTSDSEPGTETHAFASPAELATHFSSCIHSGKTYIAYAVHYPDTGGFVEDRRVSLNPQKCNGHTFRYSVGGWGVIHVQFHISKSSQVTCSVSVNSRARATAWFDTYPELKNPDLWHWPMVEKHARRLLRRLKDLAQQNIPADRPRTGSG